jgi:hypothetical protein
MFQLPVRTWVLNAAAVLSGRQGAVSRPAEQAECSRATVDEHARKVEQRLAPEPGADAALAALRAEKQPLRQMILAALPGMVKDLW